MADKLESTPKSLNYLKLFWSSVVSTRGALAIERHRRQSPRSALNLVRVP
jgi:hypothetical protein